MLFINITKFYLVNISYSFDAVGGGGSQVISASIRDDDSQTYSDAQFSAITNQQIINLSIQTKYISIILQNYNKKNLMYV